jgi:hypothetical protein
VVEAVPVKSRDKIQEDDTRFITTTVGGGFTDGLPSSPLSYDGLVDSGLSGVYPRLVMLSNHDTIGRVYAVLKEDRWFIQLQKKLPLAPIVEDI